MRLKSQAVRERESSLSRGDGMAGYGQTLLKMTTQFGKTTTENLKKRDSREGATAKPDHQDYY